MCLPFSTYRPGSISRVVVVVLLLVIFGLTACGNSSAILPTPANTPTPTQSPSETPLPPTPEPSPTPEPTPAIVRTPPPLPYPYQSSQLNPLDYPHTYIQDACQYLNLKWDPTKSTPGTVVMVLMFHSLSKDAVYTDLAHMNSDPFFNAMRTLHEQGFEAIDMEQFVGFMESNEKIPERSILVIVDDRHSAQYFNNFYRPLYEDYGWPVVNGWISHPEQTIAGLWDENEALNREGWVDYQAHGVIHYPILESSTDDYIMTELQGSIDFIQVHYQKTPIAFIWPGGNFTQRSVQLARYVGYKVGFTVNPRGPVMFNWVPLADQDDPMRPSYLSEGAINDPLMVIPRYWPSQIIQEVDAVRIMGKEAAAFAEANKGTELEFYDIVCAASLGPIPNLNP